MAAGLVTDLVAHANVADVRSGISARYWFRVGSYILEALGELSLAVSTILLALEVPLGNPSLKYWAIGLNVGAIALRLLKGYSLRESRNRTLEINIITKKLGVDSLPDIVLDQEVLTARGFSGGSNSPPQGRLLSAPPPDHVISVK
jgi:hypothetical protein